MENLICQDCGYPETIYLKTIRTQDGKDVSLYLCPECQRVFGIVDTNNIIIQSIG